MMKLTLIFVLSLGFSVFASNKDKATKCPLAIVQKNTCVSLSWKKGPFYPGESVLEGRLNRLDPSKDNQLNATEKLVYGLERIDPKSAAVFVSTALKLNFLADDHFVSDPFRFPSAKGWHFTVELVADGVVKEKARLALGDFKCELAFNKRGVCIEYRWVKGPSRNNPEGDVLQAWLTFQNPEGNAPGRVLPKGEELFFDLWMQMGDHGHGSRPVVMEEKPGNLYEIKKIYFIMKGKWQLRFHVVKSHDKKQVVESVVKEVEIP